MEVTEESKALLEEYNKTVSFLPSTTPFLTIIPILDQEVSTTPPVISIVYCYWNRTLMWGGGANSKPQVARPLTSEPHLNADR